MLTLPDYYPLVAALATFPQARMAARTHHLTLAGPVPAGDMPARRAGSNAELSAHQAAWCVRPLPAFSDDKHELAALIEEFRHRGCC